MRHAIQRFLVGDDGAVTVDWVVLSAAIIGIGMVILGPIGLSADSAAVGVAGDIRDVDLPYDPN